ncbi:MAG: hypothetical protein IPL28_05650 [Chloroflexi bacterium]|nr:hypothetical protein [Chloroflexota bacterium]
MKEQGGKLEGNDDSQIKDMKYDPAAVTESDTGPRLPTWSQLAYGTIQMQEDAPLVEEEKAERENLTAVPETTSEEEQAPAAEPAAEEAEAPQMDRGKMILDSIGTGLLQGAVGGAQEMVVDKVFDFATTHGPGKKIPYADGLMAMGQIAMDPNGWWEGGFGQAISAFREGGLFSSEGAWAKIGDEKTWAGKIAGVCEALVATIDLINSILGAIQQVLTIILFILGVTAAILTATGVAAAAAAVILKIIAWIEKILNIIAKIADFLSYGIKPPVQLLAIIFRAVDIAIFEGDPDELMAKQALLTKSVTSFAKDATQRGLQKAYDKGVNKLDNKLLASEKSKKMKEIESVDDTTAPPGKKKQDLVDAYESKYGSSYDADVKRKGKEELTDSDRLADLGAQKKKAQKEFDEATKFKKKDGTAVDEVGAKRAQKQLDDATANFDAAQARNTQLNSAMTTDATFQGKVTTENATITNKFDTDKGTLDPAKSTADTAAPGKLNDHDTAIAKTQTDLDTANTTKATKDTAKTTADTEAAQAKTQVDTAKAELKQAKTDLQKAKQDLKNAKTDSEKATAKTELDKATAKVQDKTTELGTKQTDLQTKKQTQKQKALEAQQAAQQVEVQKQVKKDAEKAKTDFEAAETARQKKYDDDVKAAEKKRDDDLSKKKAELENEFEKNWQKQQAEASKTEKDTSKGTSDTAAGAKEQAKGFR